MVYEEFKKSSMEDAGLLDKKGFLAYYKDFLDGKPRMDPSLIFRIFIFEKWHKTHFN
jgi:hypothetical protein